MIFVDPFDELTAGRGVVEKIIKRRRDERGGEGRTVMTTTTDSNEILILFFAGPIKKNNEKYNRPNRSRLSPSTSGSVFFRRIFRPINLIIAITA